MPPVAPDLSLDTATVAALTAALSAANRELARMYPGESGRRQPVHTVYGGAHLFHADTCPKLGQLAQKSLREHAPDAASFARALGMPEKDAADIYQRVTAKLGREPVEDFRIDFEDGYGHRTDNEEDGHAVAAARQLAAAQAAGTHPPFAGIRIKPFTDDLAQRSLRTLDLFVTALHRETAGRLTPNFVVTLPKITVATQVAVLAHALDELENRLKMPSGTLQLEIMIETPQAILDASGQVPILSLVAAARGRCAAAHFGTYDYTAACGIAAAAQSMTHPASDFAKHVMQVSLAGTGVWLSDGATNLMPVGPRDAVHAAWQRHFANLMHSLRGGFYQGWDLHPAQLPARYAAVFWFFRESLPAASQRLRNFIEKAAQAALVGNVFDDAATAQGLLNFFLRGINCSAISEAEAASTGLTAAELRSRSFLQIVQNRR